jgi:hypothetical protein
LDGRSVTLIDTPGFDDTTKSDADVLQMIAIFLAAAYVDPIVQSLAYIRFIHNVPSYKAEKNLAGVVYIHRISDPRVGGMSARNFKMLRELCGEDTLRNVVIVTNRWGEVSLEDGEAREAELTREDIFFKPVLDKGAQMLRHHNSPESAHKILARIINNHPLPLQIQREIVDQKKKLSDTAAGAELNRELIEQFEKNMEDMERLKAETEGPSYLYFLT